MVPSPTSDRSGRQTATESKGCALDRSVGSRRTALNITRTNERRRHREISAARAIRLLPRCDGRPGARRAAARSSAHRGVSEDPHGRRSPRDGPLRQSGDVRRGGFDHSLERVCSPASACAFSIARSETIVERDAGVLAQTLGGLQALTISHSSEPTFRKWCGRVLLK